MTLSQERAIKNDPASALTLINRLEERNKVLDFELSEEKIVTEHFNQLYKKEQNENVDFKERIRKLEQQVAVKDKALEFLLREAKVTNKNKKPTPLLAGAIKLADEALDNGGG